MSRVCTVMLFIFGLLAYWLADLRFLLCIMCCCSEVVVACLLFIREMYLQRIRFPCAASLFLIGIIVCFKQYCAPMFLDSLTSTLTSNTPGSIITSTSHHESSTHVSSSSRNETGVITSSGSTIPDIISLD